ncbi:MAG: HupE/UreJ family protein [Dokdonella sp.]
MNLRWFSRLGFLLALAPCFAFAHKASDAFLVLHTHATEGFSGQWDIALRDLDVALAIDANADHEITWGELKAARSTIENYAFSHLALTSGTQACKLSSTDLLVDKHSDGNYAVVRFDAACTPGDTLTFDYRLLQGIDASHRGLLQLVTTRDVQSGVLVPGIIQTISLAAPSRWRQFTQYLHEGTWHIWTGYDHMLFLISLLLPAVLRRREGDWTFAESMPKTLWRVTGVVTAFTLAHSITLTLAALDIVHLPSRLVESGIALSVVLAAVNNVRPLVTERTWAFAFGFGLLHGFGFANALADLGLPRDALALCLFAFNLGVEIGQLAIVAAFFPLAWMLRKTTFYRRVLLVPGSLIIALLAMVWLTERVFDLRLLPILR